MDDGVRDRATPLQRADNLPHIRRIHLHESRARHGIARRAACHIDDLVPRRNQVADDESTDNTAASGDDDTHEYSLRSWVRSSKFEVR